MTRQRLPSPNVKRTEQQAKICGKIKTLHFYVVIINSFSSNRITDMRLSGGYLDFLLHAINYTRRREGGDGFYFHLRERQARQVPQQHQSNVSENIRHLSISSEGITWDVKKTIVYFCFCSEEILMTCQSFSVRMLLMVVGKKNHIKIWNMLHYIILDKIMIFRYLCDM